MPTIPVKNNNSNPPNIKINISTAKYIKLIVLYKLLLEFNKVMHVNTKLVSRAVPTIIIEPVTTEYIIKNIVNGNKEKNNKVLKINSPVNGLVLVSFFISS